MFDLNIKDIIFIKEIIDLDIEISIKKIITSLIFKINSDNIYTKMALIDQDIIVLF